MNTTHQNNRPQQRPAYRRGFLKALLLAGAAALQAAYIAFPSCIRAEDITYPSDFTGVHNVKTEFGAKGDGTTDDTTAIEKGLNAVNSTYQMLYFPNGTYLVSRKLFIKPWTIIQGQSEAGTIIKLANKCAGFNDKASPRAVVQTHPDGGDKMNMQFNIYINNFTINTGSENPGACGIRFIANNGGGMGNITVKSGDSQGFAGFDLTANWDGPQYSHHLTVTGFDYGFSIGAMHYATTLEYITISGQKVSGIRHYCHPTTIRKLTSTNTVPAIINDNPHKNHDNPLLVLLDSDLRGGSSTNCAIKHIQGSLFARNVKTQGYKAALENAGVVVEGNTLREYSTMPVRTLFGGQTTSLNLPIKETLEQPRDALSQWVNIQSFSGRKKGNDWGPAIQAAIDSGRTTIYFPSGGYTIDSTVLVRGAVKVFQGMGGGLEAGKHISRTTPMFRIVDGTAPAVFFDFHSFTGEGIHIESASKRTLVVKHSRWLHYQSKPGAGDLFVDDAAGSLYYFDHPQKVFLRALNAEGGHTSLFNNAADLVVLNHKTEGQGTSIVTGAAGRTEILGGLNYPAGGDCSINPAYINNGGEMTVIQFQWWSQSTTVRETRNNQTKTYLRDGGSEYFFYTAKYLRKP